MKTSILEQFKIQFNEEVKNITKYRTRIIIHSTTTTNGRKKQQMTEEKLANRPKIRRKRAFHWGNLLRTLLGL